MAIESILTFLVLQDALFDGVTSDPTLCALIREMYDVYDVAPPAPCHFFTGRRHLEKHLAHGLPVDDVTDECRLFVSKQFSVELKATYVACVHETFPVKYTTFITGTACAELADSAVGRLHASQVSKLMVAADEYKTRGSDDKALAQACFASDQQLDAVVSAGKAVAVRFREMLAEATEEVDTFIKWYAINR